MNFVVVDVETANSDMASVCQIGVVRFESGAVAETWSRLVDPEDDFDGMNIRVHGITPEAVRGAPTFPALAAELFGLLSGAIVVSHTHFDRLSLARAADRHGLAAAECRWLDSCLVARRAWPHLPRHGLGPLAKEFAIDFRHHDASEDARAAGEILLRAIAHTSIGVEEWLSLSRKPIGSPDASRPGVARKGNPDGPLAGETIVFTGALAMTRAEAADLAAEAGCDVSANVTLSVTILVVGDQDVRRLSGQEKSSKHRKAEELSGKGQPIRILMESDFRRLLATF